MKLFKWAAKWSAALVLVAGLLTIYYFAFFPKPLPKTIYTYTSDFVSVEIAVFEDNVECSAAYQDSVRSVISKHTIAEIMEDSKSISLEVKEHFDNSDKYGENCEPTELITEYTFNFER